MLAVRELARQDGVTDQTRDLAAFIAIALQIIADGIDASVTAWEKRDYWIKADRFRLEWAWAGQISEKMRISVLADDWGTVATLSAQVAQKLAKVQVSENHRLGRPWVGAYQELIRNKTT